MATPNPNLKHVRTERIEGQLTELTAKLDQQSEQAFTEDIRITRETTEALLLTMEQLMKIRREAEELRNTRLLGRINAQIHLAREALGMEPRRRRTRIRR